MIINRTSVSEQIFEDVVRQIRAGELRQGQKLVIKNLQDMYNVSSTPVRDALNRLSNAGFVNIGTAGTAEVITMSADDCRDIVAINEELTRMSFRLIMRNNMAPKLLPVMGPLYEKELALKAAPTAERIAAFVNFVNVPGKMTGNLYYGDMTGTLRGKSVVAFGDYTQIFDPDEALENNRQMVEALQGEDWDAFQQLRFFMTDSFRKFLDKRTEGAPQR